MDNSRSMVEMHSSICEDIAGNSTNISPKAGVGGSNPFWRASQVRKPFTVFRACFYLTELDKNNVSSNFLYSFSNDVLSARISFLSNARCMVSLSSMKNIDKP